MGTPINNLNRMVPGLIEQPAAKPTSVAAPGTNSTDKGSFADVFSDLVGSVNDLQSEAGLAQKALLSGDPVELHDVMIKLEQAGVAMDLLLEIRNRLLNGFTELMRMPM